MKYPTKQTLSKVLALVLLTLAASGVLAADKITYEDGQLTIESTDSEKMIILNADGMQDIIADIMHETMDGMNDVMAELDEMQLEIRLGEDNQLSIETEDQMWEMNLDLIFREIGTVMETAFQDLDTDGWTTHEHWEIESDGDEISTEKLAEELNRLKDELKELQKELQRELKAQKEL